MKHRTGCKGVVLVQDDRTTTACTDCAHKGQWSDVPMDVTRGRWGHPVGVGMGPRPVEGDYADEGVPDPLGRP